MTSATVNLWVLGILGVLFAIDLVMIVRPRLATVWLQQWLTWMNRLTRGMGLECRVADEERCRRATRVVGLAYGAALVWLAWKLFT